MFKNLQIGVPTDLWLKNGIVHHSSQKFGVVIVSLIQILLKILLKYTCIYSGEPESEAENTKIIFRL